MELFNIRIKQKSCQSMNKYVSFELKSKHRIVVSTLHSLSDNSERLIKYVSQTPRSLRHSPKIQIHATECRDSVARERLVFSYSQTDCP